MKWYPTATRIPGGKVLVTGGLARQTGPFDAPFENRRLSLFDSAAYDLGRDPWSILVESESSSPVVELAAFDYPHVVTLPKPLPAAQAGGFDRQVAIVGGLTGQIAFLSLDPGVPQNQRLFVLLQARRPSGDGTQAKPVDTTMSLPSTGEILIIGPRRSRHA